MAGLSKESLLHRYDSKNEDENKDSKPKIKINTKSSEDNSKKENKPLFSFGGHGTKDNKDNSKQKDDDKYITLEGFEDNEITGIRISKMVKSPEELDSEYVQYCGMTYDEALDDLEMRKMGIQENLKNFVSDGFIDTATKDLNLVFDTILKPLVKISFMEGVSVTKQILRRVEKIVAADEDFFKRSDNDKMNAFNAEIGKYLPTHALQTYGHILTTERNNPFSIYYNLLQDIQAQDFIITGDFLNVQYKLGEYFYIDIPEYLIELNGLFVDHISTDYMYSIGEKFGPKDAIKDLEDQGFRFNFIHKKIVATGYSIMFIRKNVHGVQASIEGSTYYTDLLSEMDAPIEEKEALIERIRDIATRKNFLVVGPTGSGKTTLLRQLLLDKQREQNLITIEDTRELYLPNAVSYLTDKDHSIHDIFVSTLRMNPSRVVVGETRDITIIDILEVCLTARSATTLHATDMDKCISRIHQMCRSANISSDELDFLISSAIDMFVFIIDRKIKGIYIRDPKKHFDSVDSIFECYENAYLHD